MQCLEQCGPQAISGGSRMWLPLHSRWLRTQSCHMISPVGMYNSMHVRTRSGMSSSVSIGFMLVWQVCSLLRGPAATTLLTSATAWTSQCILSMLPALIDLSVHHSPHDAISSSYRLRAHVSHLSLLVQELVQSSRAVQRR